MKKWIVLVMVTVLALAVTPLALAGHGHGHKHAKGKNKFQLVGTISDVGADTLTVTVKSGTKTIKAFRESGDPMTIAVPEGAKIRLIVDGEAVTVTLDQLGVGAKVKIGGTIARADGGATFTATRVLAHPAPVVEPVPEPAPVPDPTPTEDPVPTPDPSPVV